jgi:hypothetical protein
MYWRRAEARHLSLAELGRAVGERAAKAKGRPPPELAPPRLAEFFAAVDDAGLDEGILSFSLPPFSVM